MLSATLAAFAASQFDRTSAANPNSARAMSRGHRHGGDRRHVAGRRPRHHPRTVLGVFILRVMRNGIVLIACPASPTTSYGAIILA